MFVTQCKKFFKNYFTGLLSKHLLQAAWQGDIESVKKALVRN